MSYRSNWGRTHRVNVRELELVHELDLLGQCPAVNKHEDLRCLRHEGHDGQHFTVKEGVVSGIRTIRWGWVES